MAFIEYVDCEDSHLDPDNIIRIHGINPAVLKGHLELYKPIMFGRSPLSRFQREVMAVVVSSVNGCHY